jgi:hypothetical protein
LFDCGDAGESLFQLKQEIEQSIKQCYAKLDINLLDLRKFVFRHLQAMIKVEKELERSPVSERSYKLVKPVDVEKLSLKGQCFYELFQEQLDKHTADGTGGDVIITEEMIEAKMREKTLH